MSVCATGTRYLITGVGRNLETSGMLYAHLPQAMSIAHNETNRYVMYVGVSKSFPTGRLERELQMVQLCATRCSRIAILWVSLVSFAAITLCVASQRLFTFVVVVVYFVVDSVRKRFVTPSYQPSSQRVKYLKVVSPPCVLNAGCFKSIFSWWQYPRLYRQ
jgi:hypothetical protein